MAATLTLPKKVHESNWKDDIDIDYAIYGDDEKEEAEYISPESVSKESIKKIKSIYLRQRFSARGKNVISAFDFSKAA